MNVILTIVFKIVLPIIGVLVINYLVRLARLTLLLSNYPRQLDDIVKGGITQEEYIRSLLNSTYPLYDGWARLRLLEKVFENNERGRK